MAGETPAIVALVRAALPFTAHRYDYDPDVESIGMAAALALGEPPSRVLKTLMARVNGKPACAIIASDRTLAMKRLAVAAGGRSAAMMPPAEAERLTGYKVGGISPVGQKKAVPIFLDAAAAAEVEVYINGGRRGLQIRMSPAALIAATSAIVAALVA